MALTSSTCISNAMITCSCMHIMHPLTHAVPTSDTTCNMHTDAYRSEHTLRTTTNLLELVPAYTHNTLTIISSIIKFIVAIGASLHVHAKTSIQFLIHEVCLGVLHSHLDGSVFVLGLMDAAHQTAGNENSRDLYRRERSKVLQLLQLIHVAGHVTCTVYSAYLNNAKGHTHCTQDILTPPQEVQHSVIAGL